MRRTLPLARSRSRSEDGAQHPHARLPVPDAPAKAERAAAACSARPDGTVVGMASDDPEQLRSRVVGHGPPSNPALRGDLASDLEGRGEARGLFPRIELSTVPRVALPARCENSLEVLVRPLPDCKQGAGEGPAQRRERILDSNRSLGEHLPANEAVALERFERLAQNLLRDEEMIVEPAVTTNPRGEQEEQVDLPLRREEPHRGGRGLDHLPVVGTGPALVATPSDNPKGRGRRGLCARRAHANELPASLGV